MHYLPLLADAAKAIAWQSTDTHIRRPGPNSGEVRGKGVALMIEHTLTRSRSEATIELTAEGDCTILASAVEMGQGARTSLHQLVADELGVPLTAIRAPGRCSIPTLRPFTPRPGW